MEEYVLYNFQGNKLIQILYKIQKMGGFCLPDVTASDQKKTFSFCNMIGIQRINANTITTDMHDKCLHYHSAYSLQ